MLCGRTPWLAFHVGTPANHLDLGDSGGIDPASGFSPFVFSTPLSQLSIFARNQPEWRGAIRLTYEKEPLSHSPVAKSH